MKIAVLAANGAAGSAIVKEAVARGHEVTAVVRSEKTSPAQHVLIKDIMDLNKEDLANFDAVVTAFGAFAHEHLPQHTTTIEHVAGLLAGSDVRYYLVGGAGSLYMDKEHSMQLSQTPDFPEDFKPLAEAMAAGLNRLRDFNTVNWTYVSPAADFEVDYPRTGRYQLAGEEFTVNEAGESKLSYADYATAMVDVIESGKYNQERISVIGV